MSASEHRTPGGFCEQMGELAQPNKLENLDYLQLVRLLPEEIWRLVLENVSSSTDYLNVTLASPVLRQLSLSTLPVKQLFAQIAPLLNANWTNKYLSSKDFLNCRLVCRQWNQAVESMFQNVNDRTSLEKFQPGSDCLHQQRFSFPEDAESFLRNTHLSHTSLQNPFPYRSVRFSFRMFPGFVSPVVLELFAKFGHHIHFLTVEFPHISINVSAPVYIRNFMQLRKVLQLTPNLTLLEAIYTDCTYNLRYQEVTDLMATMLQVRRFPKLHHLVCVRFKNVPPTLLPELLKMNPHVQTLELEYSFSRLERVGLIQSAFSRGICQLPSNNSKNMSLCIFTHGDINMLQNVQLDWPYLVVLKLDIKICLLDLEDFFRVICRAWGQSLVDFSIKLKGVKPLGKHVSLQLPKLERFVLEMYQVVSIDFILPVKQSLTLLSVFFKIADEGNDEFDYAVSMERAIDFLNCRKNLLKSNIWELFPNLKTVMYSSGPQYQTSFQKKITYTRAEYKQYIRSKK